MAPSPVPKQLSPALLDVLLQELTEYNGVDYGQVPLQTFRDKYVGLYFATAQDPGCVSFLWELKAFRDANRERLEVVLVSCDAGEEGWRRHAKLSTLPAYRSGDYRVVLLRNHFAVEKCPRLGIVDPNGVVVTADGVSKILGDPQGLHFPWCEGAVQALYGDEGQGRLGRVLEGLRLPPWKGVPAADREVVGLLFGDLWDPEARELLARAEFLLEQLGKRPAAQGERPLADRCAVYLVHSDDLAGYAAFEECRVTLPTARLEDDERREATRAYFDTPETPAFCIALPRLGRVVSDGAAWLRRDPTGVHFPWHQGAAEDCASGDTGAVRHLSEEALHGALCRGPLFVALLSDADACEHATALANLRAAAAAFASDGSAGESLDAARRCLALPAFCQPQQPPRGQEAEPRARVLWRGPPTAGAQRAARGGAHGSAPWNQVRAAGREAPPLAFFYTAAEGRAAHLLQSFCTTDARALQRHQFWLGQRTEEDREAFRACGEAGRKLAQLTAAAEALRALASGGQQPSSPSQRRGVRAAEEDTRREPSPDSGEEGLRFWPRTRSSVLQGAMTEGLLEDSPQGRSSAVIVDLARGVYFLCGTLADEKAIPDFLEAWRAGTPGPLEIGAPSGEAEGDEGDLDRGALEDTALTRAGTMPGVVIWIPSREHSDQAQPADMYRALLNYACRRAPRSDDSAAVPPAGACHFPKYLDSLPPGGRGRLQPWIEQLWVFGLEDCPEAREECGAGSWQAPSAGWLQRLHKLVAELAADVPAEPASPIDAGPSTCSASAPVLIPLHISWAIAPLPLRTFCSLVSLLQLFSLCDCLTKELLLSGPRPPSKTARAKLLAEESLSDGVSLEKALAWPCDLPTETCTLSAEFHGCCNWHGNGSAGFAISLVSGLQSYEVYHCRVSLGSAMLCYALSALLCLGLGLGLRLCVCLRRCLRSHLPPTSTLVSALRSHRPASRSGLAALRRDHASGSLGAVGNERVCMRTARTRSELYRMVRSSPTTRF